jgi:hypothetical protein
VSWETIYNYLGIRDFIYFISSPEIQETLFPVKIVFVAFTLFFLAAVIYFMVTSSYLQHHFLQDVTEFFSWQPYGLREIAKRWKKIQKRIETGAESDLKLAIIEADDFLGEMLEERDYPGKTFDEKARAGKAILPNLDEILEAHAIRNSIVYDPDYKVGLEQAKKILAVYESAIKNIGTA